MRLAVLRFENLTSDASLDWMGRAASEIISLELAGGKSAVLSVSALHASPFAQHRPLPVPGESTERDAAIAEGATRIVIGQISRVGNRLVIDVTERDPVSLTTVENFTLASPNTADLYSLADGVARHISPEIAPFETRNNQAIAAWARGMEEPDFEKLTGDYAEAVKADPQFASAWLAWATVVAGHNDRTGAARILAEAQQHASGFSAVNRARLKLATMEITGDRAATLSALNELGRLTPGDPVTLHAVAERNYAAHRYADAVAAYRRVTELNPESGAAWNELGYALLAEGDYDGAMSALRTYQRLAPGDANPLDSQGDVAFAFGRFSEAEQLYGEATAKDPAFTNSGPLYKAAVARLMTGDIAGADKKFEAWAALRRAAKDPSLPFLTAQWYFISGRHDQAISILSNIGSSAGAAQWKVTALTQMAVWDLQLGRRDRALRESSDALKTGAPSATTVIVRVACEDARSAADWSVRVDRLLGTPQVAQLKPTALAYALYLSKQWDAAAPLWKQLTEAAAPDDGVTPAIYAQILMELKRPKEAAPYVHLFPIPHSEGPQEFVSFAIPEIFETRAGVLASEGKTAESEASRKVYKTLSGTL